MKSARLRRYQPALHAPRAFRLNATIIRRLSLTSGWNLITALSTCLDPVCGKFWTFCVRPGELNSLQLRLKTNHQALVTVSHGLICVKPQDTKAGRNKSVRISKPSTGVTLELDRFERPRATANWPTASPPL